MINPFESARNILLANVGVTTQVSSRIWGGLVPPSEVSSMPRKSIAFFMDGLPQNPLLPVLEFRLIIWCFGAEPGFLEAWQVAGAVHDCLKRRGNETIAVTGGVAYYYRSDCMRVGYEVSEPVTHWPKIVSEYEIEFYETVV